MIISFNKRIFYTSLIILIVIYLVGLIGLNTSFRVLVASLTPYTLVLSAVIVLINNRDWNRYFAIFIVITWITGYLVELAGIETGLIFGNYTYGEALGYKLYKVPVIIGLNWFLLVYSCGMVSNLLRWGVIMKSMVSAFLMVVIDMSLEPVAVALDFWSWQGGDVPVQNYIGWFVVAFLLSLYFQSIGLKVINRMAIALFIIQYIFFFILSYTLY